MRVDEPEVKKFGFWTIMVKLTLTFGTHIDDRWHLFYMVESWPAL